MTNQAPKSTGSPTSLSERVSQQQKAAPQECAGLWTACVVLVKDKTRLLLLCCRLVHGTLVTKYPDGLTMSSGTTGSGWKETWRAGCYGGER